VRDGREIQLTMIAEEQPGEYTAADLAPRQERPEPQVRAAEPRAASLGVELETLTPQLAKWLGTPAARGVVITGVHRGSLADEVGLEPGMVITQINRQPVASAEQARKQLDGPALERGVLLLIATPEGSRFVVVRS
jgi:serine protease Do